MTRLHAHSPTPTPVAGSEPVWGELWGEIRRHAPRLSGISRDGGGTSPDETAPSATTPHRRPSVHIRTVRGLSRCVHRFQRMAGSDTALTDANLAVRDLDDQQTARCTPHY